MQRISPPSARLPFAPERRYSPGMFAASGDKTAPGDSGTSEPHVFECRQCGKVFEAYATRAFCPECDSGDVERLTEEAVH